MKREFMQNIETEIKNLQTEIETAEATLEPKKQRLNELWQKRSKACEERIALAQQKKAKFDADELVFAAFDRCFCGAGYAYPKQIGMHGSWYCSAILLGKAEAGTSHDRALPFAFYNVKSEIQPSANGATTRPTQ